MLKANLGEVEIRGPRVLLQAELSILLNTLYEKKILTEEQLHETVTYSCHVEKLKTDLTPEEQKKCDEVIDVLKILDEIEDK